MEFCRKDVSLLKSFLHKENVPHCLQGDGGFHLVPKWQRHSDSWLVNTVPAHLFMQHYHLYRHLTPHSDGSKCQVFLTDVLIRVLPLSP